MGDGVDTRVVGEGSKVWVWVWVWRGPQEGLDRERRGEAETREVDRNKYVALTRRLVGEIFGHVFRMLLYFGQR